MQEMDGYRSHAGSREFDLPSCLAQTLLAEVFSCAILFSVPNNQDMSN